MTAFITEHRGRFGVEPICEVLGAGVSTFNAAKDRPPSARALRDQQLLAEIRRAHAENYGVYGARNGSCDLLHRLVGGPDVRLCARGKSSGIEPWSADPP